MVEHSLRPVGVRVAESPRVASTSLLVDLGVDVVMTAGVLLKKQSVSLQIPFITLVCTKGN